jgi:hypothetical protein
MYRVLSTDEKRSRHKTTVTPLIETPLRRPYLVNQANVPNATTDVANRDAATTDTNAPRITATTSKT